jgi:hypothetical protein
MGHDEAEPTVWLKWFFPLRFGADREAECQASLGDGFDGPFHIGKTIAKWVGHRLLAGDRNRGPSPPHSPPPFHEIA